MTLIFSFSSKRMPGVRNAATVLQLLSVLTFINARVALVSSTQSADMTVDSAINENYANAVNSLSNDAMEKRTWQQLQSAWGKRVPANNGWNVEATDDDALLAERWIPILTAGGGPLTENHPEVLKYSMVYLTNAAALERLANRHQAETANTNDDTDTASYKFNDDIFAPSDLSDNDSLSSEKRNWKSMNAAWGKRINTPTWNKFRGVWGKREPGWNNLKGMWGKRASKDWQKLHTGWGKRAQNAEEMN